MADPAFMQKFFIEELVTGALSVLYEAQQRGENFVRELDLVALNTVSLMAATGAMVYLTAPSRSYGAVHKYPWQNALHNLPNHVFDANTPYRRYSLVSRAASLFTKVLPLMCALRSNPKLLCQRTQRWLSDLPFDQWPHYFHASSTFMLAPLSC